MADLEQGAGAAPEAPYRLLAAEAAERRAQEPSEAADGRGGGDAVGATALSSLPQRSSPSQSRLLRAASATFTGGGSVLPPGEDAPLNRRLGRSQSQIRLNTVQTNMLQSLQERYRIPLTIFLGVFLGFLLVMIFLFYNALYAMFTYSDVPCDQPLNMYLLISITVGQLTPQVTQAAQTMARGPRGRIMISMAGALPGWSVIFWGMWMVKSCRTCQETNPGLFYPTSNFIYGQVAMCFITTLFYSLGFTGVLAYLHAASGRQMPGCKTSVHQLPKVPNDATELIDSEDSSIMDCPICTSTLGEDVVVRTNCSHHFHEECLARWCKNHVDCPLCRAQVGSPEASAEPRSEGRGEPMGEPLLAPQ